VAVALLALLGGGVSVWQQVSRPLSPSRVIPAVQAPALPLPDKPSIAVLPFVNMSGDLTQEYFSDGMTEDLITDLSKLSGLFVIARNSVFTYKGQAVKPERVSRELGVRAAELLGQEARLGTLAEGKVADFVILDGNPLADIRQIWQVEVVLREGQIVWKK
jgi:cytosine/adenosine deaminase-related metal-dependent hydrolase